MARLRDHVREALARDDGARLERMLLLARAALFWERLWVALAPALMPLGLLLLALASGVALWLPPWARLALVLALVGWAAWRARALARLRVPGREEGLRRVEEDSGLSHQPLRALGDELAVSARDPATRALWRAHRERLRGVIRALRVGWPRSGMARHDPWALRFALLLALVVAFALNGMRHLEQWPRLAELPAFGVAVSSGAMLDAWLDPPAFTGRPPVVLARRGENLHDGRVLKVAGGTRLVLRVAANAQPVLRLHDTGAGGDLLTERPFVRAGEGQWRLVHVLRRAVVAEVRAGWSRWRWRLEVAPDAPPEITVVGEPARAASGALMLSWRARDDHGVRAARAQARLAAPRAGMLQFAPPRAALNVPPRAGREVKGTAVLKWQEHPWAGLEVELFLVARDVADQEGRSAMLRIKLPSREFRKPLARALVEQRRALVLQPRRSRQISQVLAAFIGWPEGIVSSSGQYLGIRHAALALHAARTVEEKKEIVRLLWALAVDIEDGDLAAARRALEAARKALREALREGGSPEEIARRMAELREAMNRFLSALARQQGQQSARERAAREQDTQALRPQDLERMMRQLEELARSGARRQAEQLLSQLDRMLENLQMMPRMSASPSPQERALNELRRMMQRQQELMDRTWQAQPSPPDGAPPRQGDPEMRGLQRQQRELADRMRRMLRDMAPDQGAGEGMRQAERAMRGAARELGAGQRRGALQAQRQALQAMRRTARELARQVARQRGRGMARFGGRRHDPLGRPLRGQFADPGPGRDMVPEAGTAERARRILEQLRKKAEDAMRPPLERHYIDRLLRGLF